jgi:putative SOS response-associated peptidase YedK
MPAILEEAAFEKWLDPQLRNPTEVRAMLDTAQVDFVHHAVSTRLNAARTDEAEFTNPA